jgi:hypothetical protein
MNVPAVYRPALEKGTAGATYHAVGEERVTLRRIDEAFGRPLAMFAGMDGPQAF